MTLHDHTAARVDEIITQAQASGRAPSLIAAVMRDGVLVHTSHAGDLPVPDLDTQYRIGSITKTMTAVLIMQLRDEGRLALDDPLEAHLPGTPVGTVSLRHLLAHASGMQSEPDGDWWERSPGADLDTLLAGLTPQKLALAPQRVHHYSNLAYGLLGGVVNRLSGADWRTALSKRLLGPLGLTRITYQAEHPFARGYVVHPWLDTLREEPRHDAGAMAPAGQLWATTTDLARWAAFLADPDPAVLAPTSVTEMCAPVVISDLDTWSAGHGLGLQLWRRGERIFIGHLGSMPGYLAALMVHRPSRTAVVAFANTYNLHNGSINALGQDLLATVLDNEPEPPATPWRAAASPPPEVEPLCGRWWWMGIEFEAGWDGHRRELVISRLGRAAQPWRFTPEGTDRWQCRSGDNLGELLQVRRNRANSVVALDIATFVFTRDAWPAI